MRRWDTYLWRNKLRQQINSENFNAWQLCFQCYRQRWLCCFWLDPYSRHVFRSKILHIRKYYNADLNGVHPCIPTNFLKNRKSRHHNRNVVRAQLYSYGDDIEMAGDFNLPRYDIRSVIIWRPYLTNVPWGTTFNSSKPFLGNSG